MRCFTRGTGLLMLVIAIAIAIVAVPAEARSDDSATVCMVDSTIDHDVTDVALQAMTKGCGNEPACVAENDFAAVLVGTGPHTDVAIATNRSRSSWAGAMAFSEQHELDRMIAAALPARSAHGFRTIGSPTLRI